MKKYFFLIICSIITISCSSSKKEPQEITCPDVVISKEHQSYYALLEDAGDNENNMSFVATINNFNMQCKQKETSDVESVLDLLFIANPLNETVKKYNFNYFVSILDENDDILDYQIFQVEGDFALDENDLVRETVHTESLDQYIPDNVKKYYVVVGFVLTEEKYNFINN
ncbi:MAG: hypothetical protein CFH21_00063 [Alphaproteobacteria bacterium MarineAlpha5_Bin11]|nr:MAG: hypothetical protein CFH21_00063 [Alphaproteobacteria bacterium MarineAlpha5_Bin11]PPR52215.1 MAG: hypothetical protein CFH20_00120 [Alphaproteobacteria bacterium MarineAlpha5_Bin10]|tara:strand:+ start:10378 stop:10887 length:510 start_codon:yes stop_codon:yes gene_type:complete